MFFVCCLLFFVFHVSCFLFLLLFASACFRFGIFSLPFRQTDAAAQAPMWTPPFPPERFEDYEDEAGMENQVKSRSYNHSRRFCGGVNLDSCTHAFGDELRGIIVGWFLQ